MVFGREGRWRCLGASGTAFSVGYVEILFGCSQSPPPILIMAEQKYKATKPTPTMTQAYLHKKWKEEHNTQNNNRTDKNHNTDPSHKNVDIKADTITGGLCGGSGRHRPFNLFLFLLPKQRGLDSKVCS